jgi:two-component system sensor histidine kinase KdpD
MVSHDFRSPLASIKASVTGLLQGEAEWDPAVRRELLTGIDQETNRLSRLVQDLLDMSRLEAGAWRTEREPCAPADLVGIALASLTPQEDARVLVDLPPDSPTVSVDPTQMGRVVWNLLDNALKYSEGAIEVSTSAGEGVLRLSVTDHGPGLAPGEEGRVFDKFYRGPRFRESNVPGSGLGLSVCRAIVEAHSGRLLVRNRPEGGAEFTIELPYDANPRH